MKVFIYLVLIVSLLFGMNYAVNMDGKQYAFSSKKVKYPHWQNIKKSLGIK